MLADITPDGNIYQFLLWLHILASIVGFGSTFVWPFLASKARATGNPAIMLHSTQVTVTGAKVISSPFIYGVGVTGIILVLFGATAEPAYWKFSQAWVSIAFLLYIVALVITIGFHSPNLKQMLRLQEEMTGGAPPAGGPPPQVAELQSRGKRAGMFGGILHLLFVLLLIDMVFKPFL